ncbi:MAG TPA: ATP-binding protein [Rhodanobacteraceae bacterium]|nr:ATP-binding protein [Rhodanobacteraceae bacterium]
MRLTSLEGRHGLLLAATAVGGVLVFLALSQWPLPQLIAWVVGGLDLAPVTVPDDPLLWLLLTAIAIVPLSLWLSHRSVRPLARVLRGLEGAVASYRDGDFSFSIATDRRDELGDLVRMHNALGQTLRSQRQQLAERELLLETVVQNTPVALVLADINQRVTYSNLAARHLFNDGRSLAGQDFAALLADAPEAMRRVLAAGEDSLFTVEIDGSEETFHVSQRQFRLQGRPQRLYLFRRMTRELSRQEVATWKRVIRVISHELNNSLAPISSLAHSGAELARRGEHTRLPRVFATIGERARHLHGFIDGYARFAKLPQPQPQPVEWQSFIDTLAQHCRFRLRGEAPAETARFDRAQIEQVLINLLKNAHESGSDADAVTLGIDRVGGHWRIEVADRGPGMSENVLAQALLPFYSTKRAGTGLGLALAREIAEAHGGRLSLSNRDGGGLRVTLTLPVQAGPA